MPKLKRYKYNSKKYRFWRMHVFKRDRYRCMLCGQKGSELNAHHILRKVDYPEKAYNKDNGITLCIKCHDAVTRYEPAFAELFKQIVERTITESFILAFFRQLIENYPAPVNKLKASKKWDLIPEAMAYALKLKEKIDKVKCTKKQKKQLQ